MEKNGKSSKSVSFNLPKGKNKDDENYKIIPKTNSSKFEKNYKL